MSGGGRPPTRHCIRMESCSKTSRSCREVRNRGVKAWSSGSVELPFMSLMRMVVTRLDYKITHRKSSLNAMFKKKSNSSFFKKKQHDFFEFILRKGPKDSACIG